MLLYHCRKGLSGEGLRCAECRDLPWTREKPFCWRKACEQLHHRIEGGAMRCCRFCKRSVPKRGNGTPRAEHTHTRNMTISYLCHGISLQFQKDQQQTLPFLVQQCAEWTLTPQRAISNCENFAQLGASPNKMRKRTTKLDAFLHGYCDCAYFTNTRRDLPLWWTIFIPGTREACRCPIISYIT